MLEQANQNPLSRGETVTDFGFPGSIMCPACESPRGRLCQDSSFGFRKNFHRVRWARARMVKWEMLKGWRETVHDAAQQLQAEEAAPTWAEVSREAVRRGVPGGEVERVLNWLLRDGFVEWDEGGLRVLGPLPTQSAAADV